MPESIVEHTEIAAHRERQSVAGKARRSKRVTVRAAVRAASARIRRTLQAAATRTEHLSLILDCLRENGQPIAEEIGAQEIEVTSSQVIVWRANGKRLPAEHGTVGRYVARILREIST